MRFFKLLVILYLTALTCNAQNYSVRGIVTDESGSPLPGATVSLLSVKDSSIVDGEVTSTKGSFVFTGIHKNKYLMKITYIGYSEKYLDINYTAGPLNLGKIALEVSSVVTGTVVVKADAPMATMKGDTTQYNAGAFTTNPDATAEDLVAKMPGITVQDNKVQAQGEDVKKVLVDGKPFFGEDPNSVLKNIPAEVIDKIQVFDKKSDQAEFTGFDDGNTTKTMNITTKVKYRNGVFGKAFAGGGNEEKYKAGGVLNIFNDDRRISILGQSNNVNEQNFSPEDLMGVMSSGGSKSGGGGPGMGGGPGGGGGGKFGGGGPGADPTQFLVDWKGGLTTTNAFGVNYNEEFFDKVEVTASYFFNWSRNNTESDIYRNYFTSENGLTYTENSLTNSTNMNHRFNMKIEYEIDSSNSIRIQPRFTSQPNEGSGSVLGQYLTNGSVFSTTQYTNTSDLLATNFSMPVLYRHKFGKDGRTISLNINPGYNTTEGNGTLVSKTTYFDGTDEDSTDQVAEVDKTGFTLTSSLNYTEPLDSNNSLQIRYGNSYSKSNSDKFTNDLAGDNTYSLLDTLSSSSFDSRYFSQEAELGYRFKNDNINFNAGCSYQWAKLENDRTFPLSYDITRNFNSVLFNAMMMYKFSKSENLRIHYRTNTNAPSIDQLQDVLDNSNPLQLSIGNTDLNQSYQHSVRIRYSSVNTKAGSSFFAMAGANYTDDYIARDVMYSTTDTLTYKNLVLQPGTQLSTYSNIDGYFSLNSFISYGIPLKFIKTNLNLNLMANYTKSPSSLNGKINYAETPSAGGGVFLSSNLGKNVDFMLSTNITYNKTTNSTSTSLNQEYFKQNSRARINIILFDGLVINSDLSHTYSNGVSESNDQNYLLWNIGLGWKFLKNNAGELRLSCNDILEQNSAVQYNTTETYFEDSRTNIIPRYVLLTFTYNFKSYVNND